MIGRAAEPDLAAESWGPRVVRPHPSADVLTLHGVSKSWGSRTVLDGIDLRLEPGTLTWIGGENGTGKTTLLRIAAGLIGPDRGLVEHRGLHPLRDRADYQRGVALLSAGDRGLYARLTVRHHLDLWARLALTPKAERRKRVEAAADGFGLGEILDSRVDRISMGQRQRVRIAMTFLPGPAVVLLDEPLNSLDDAGAEALCARLADLAARGGAALWVAPGSDRERAPFHRHLWLGGGRLEPAR